MFESYDLDQFGKKMKAIRNSLGYSQSFVAESIGINVDTLRKLENGYTIPRYDTLAHLSQFYKTDIHKLFNTYNKNKFIFEFYDKLDFLMLRGKFNDIKKIHEDFMTSLNTSNQIDLINPLIFNQIDGLLYATSVRYQGNIELALETILNSIKLTIPDFDIANFDSFRYTSFEIRLLLVAATCLGDLRQCELSIQISEYILTIIDSTLYSDKIEDLYVIKSLSHISYNYHRLDKHDKALEYAQKGIEISLTKGHFDLLHFLFLRKAVAEMELQLDSYVETFKKCLYVIKITDDDVHYNHMLELIKNKYELDFSNL